MTRAKIWGNLLKRHDLYRISLGRSNGFPVAHSWVLLRDSVAGKRRGGTVVLP